MTLSHSFVFSYGSVLFIMGLVMEQHALNQNLLSINGN